MHCLDQWWQCRHRPKSSSGNSWWLSGKVPTAFKRQKTPACPLHCANYHLSALSPKAIPITTVTTVPTEQLLWEAWTCHQIMLYREMPRPWYNSCFLRHFRSPHFSHNRLDCESPDMVSNHTPRAHPLTMEVTKGLKHSPTQGPNTERTPKQHGVHQTSFI